MKRLAIVTVYLAISVFNFGALNADEKVTFGCDGQGIYSNRHKAGFWVVISIMPVVGTGIAIFGTGFLENGWSLVIGCGEPGKP